MILHVLERGRGKMACVSSDFNRRVALALVTEGP